MASIKQALVVFTRVPEAGCTKTRLMPHLHESQCEELHRCFLEDIKRSLVDIHADVFVVYAPSEASKSRGCLTDIFGEVDYVQQKGRGLGERLRNAFGDIFSRGYQSCVLIGGDVPEISASIINDAFEKTRSSDIVIGPAYDGGYYLIGMSQLIEQAFDLADFGHHLVLEKTLARLKEGEHKVDFTETLYDIDTLDDLVSYQHRLASCGMTGSTATSSYLLEICKQRVSEAV